MEVDVRVLGIILIIIGVIGLVWGGVSWVRRRDTVSVGPVSVTATQREHIPVPPVVGAVCLIAGAALLIAGGRRGA